MKKLLLTILFSLSGVLPAKAGIADLSWLAGQWCGTLKGVTNEEVWLAPRGNSMIGVHRDVKKDKLVDFEYFRVVEEGDELVYHAQPGGRLPTQFRAKSASGNRVDFVNPQHDFPKRITYQRVDAKTLKARIDGGDDASKSMEWIWTQDCSPMTK